MPYEGNVSVELLPGKVESKYWTNSVLDAREERIIKYRIGYSSSVAKSFEDTRKEFGATKDYLRNAEEKFVLDHKRFTDITSKL